MTAFKTGAINTGPKGWGSLFDDLGVDWCPGGCATTYSHQSGALQVIWTDDVEAPPANEIFHWSNRRMGKESIYKAVRHIVEQRNPALHYLPPWRGLFLMHKEVRIAMKSIGRAFPRSFADTDRAKLRYLLSEYTLEQRRRMTPAEQLDFRQALRWAARS